MRGNEYSQPHIITTNCLVLFSFSFPPKDQCNNGSMFDDHGISSSAGAIQSQLISTSDTAELRTLVEVNFDALNYG